MRPRIPNSLRTFNHWSRPFRRNESKHSQLVASRFPSHHPRHFRPPQRTQSATRHNYFFKAPSMSPCHSRHTESTHPQLPATHPVRNSSQLLFQSTIHVSMSLPPHRVHTSTTPRIVITSCCHSSIPPLYPTDEWTPHQLNDEPTRQHVTPGGTRCLP
jgi:hypothetical protein